jgi:hypothetical protein
MLQFRRMSAMGKAAAVVAMTLFVAGCTWWEENRAPVHGSIKDDAVATRPRPKPAKIASERPVKQASVAIASPIVTSSAAPLVPPPAAPSPAAKPDRAAEDSRMITAELLAEGRRLFGLGMVIEARKRLFAAMDGAKPDVFLALARTFDVHYLSGLQKPDGAPDMDRAMALYRKAAEQGAREALEDIARIEKASLPAPVSVPSPAAQPSAAPGQPAAAPAQPAAVPDQPAAAIAEPQKQQ